jgi:hypothetical protein
MRETNLLINIFYSIHILFKCYNYIRIRVSFLLFYYTYNTSGANETILVKFNCLNSRAIAPKILVPLGFPS